MESKKFSAGNLVIDGNVFLSPMAGISDSPYRALCRKMGSGFSYTEFVNAQAILEKDERQTSSFRFQESERPLIFQIFGSEPETILEAALIARELGPDMIDLNMGCSVNRVSQKGAGAGLLREPEKAGQIIRLLSRHLDIPVSAKIRLGWDEKSINCVETALILEDAGAAMISVHGRTKSQAYSGTADWDAIGNVKSRLRIPVLGSGDVASFSDAIEKISAYGVDGVLIGRKAIGNPWIFNEDEGAGLSFSEILSVVRGHFQAYFEFYRDQESEETIVRSFRKFSARYFLEYPEAKKAFLEAQNLEQIQGCLDFRIPEERAA